MEKYDAQGAQRCTTFMDPRLSRLETVRLGLVWAIQKAIETLHMDLPELHSAPEVL